jgi:flagellar biosynthesis protein FlhG
MSFRYPTKTISVTSGKGGVGKTTLACNLAYKLSRYEKKVLIFDADLGMSNVDIFFGTRAETTIFDVMSGKKNIEDALVRLDSNLYLISGGHGIDQMQNLDAYARRTVLDSLKELPMSFDYMVIDTSPGISQNVLHMNAAAKNNIVVITADPSSFADSYALIKVLNQKYKVNRFSIVSNCVKNQEDGFYLFKRFQDVVQKFLFVSLDYLGAIPQDSQLKSANINKRIILKQDPTSDAAIAISQISSEILKSQYKINSSGGLEMFWDNLARATS